MNELIELNSTELDLVSGGNWGFTYNYRPTTYKVENVGNHNGNENTVNIGNGNGINITPVFV